MVRSEDFDPAWILDSEYRPDPGNGVAPVFIAGVDAASGRADSLWADAATGHRPGWVAEPDALCLAYNWQAEADFYLAMGWPLPSYAIDLMVEFMLFRNAALPKRVRDDQPGFHGGFGLLAAARYFGVPLDAEAERNKSLMRDVILRHTHYTAAQREDIAAYCLDDVRVTRGVWDGLRRSGHFDGDQLAAALRRGRSVLDCAAMKARGIPVDAGLAERFNGVMERGYGGLVRRFDPGGRFFEGTRLRQDRIAGYAADSGIAWPRTPSGRLSIADETLARLEAMDPKLGQLRTLMGIRDDFKGFDLDVGRDGRLRFDARPFWSCTGRCQPAGNKTLFGKDAYLRGLVVAPAGRCLLYVDYHAEEIGVAAYLSGDRKMIELYEAEGDIYLRFGAMAGLIPQARRRSRTGRTARRS